MRGSLTFGPEGNPYWTAQWSGRLRFEPVSRFFTKAKVYKLARGSSVSWTISGTDSDNCTYAGSGSLDVTKLEGQLSLGNQLREGLWNYAIEVRSGDSPDGRPLMPIDQTCDGGTGVIDAATAHGRFPFVVSAISGQAAARNVKTNSIVLNGSAEERGARWTWRVAGPIFADGISQHGIDFIKEWEGLWQPCTRDGKRWAKYGTRPPAGYTFICTYNDSAPQKNCTIGYGKMLHRGPCTAADNQLRWTREQAERELYDEVKKQKYEGVVRAFSRKYGLTQCQFDALMSFVYNAGPGGKNKKTGKLNGFKWLTAPPNATDLGYPPGTKLLAVWEALIPGRLPRYTTEVGVVLPGLVQRRMAEFILFTTAKCPCAGVAGPRTNDPRLPKVNLDPCKPPPGYKKAEWCK